MVFRIMSISTISPVATNCFLILAERVSGKRNDVKLEGCPLVSIKNKKQSGRGTIGYKLPTITHKLTDRMMTL